MSCRKDLEKLIRDKRAEGWVIVQTSGKHYKWTAPTGAFFFSSSTPSDWRALRKIEMHIRQCLRGVEARVRISQH
jgi:hypothetical protein